MSYSDLQANQDISFNNLQSGVSEGYFTAKTTIPSGLKQITKTEANTYVNINTSLPSYAVKASNELVTRQDLSGVTSTSPYIMYGVTNTYGYKSVDGGNTFTALSGLPSLFWTAIAGDSTGLYIAAICFTQNNQIYISNDGGVTFTAKTISFVLVGFYATGVSMSANGQYVAVSGLTTAIGGMRNALVSVSSNYGSSFSSAYGDSTSYVMYNVPSGKVSVSGNGQYITAVFGYEVDPGWPNIPRPWSFRVYSSNYGASFTKSGGSEFCLFMDIALSYTGQYQFLTSDWLKPGFFGSVGMKAFVSNNYGSSFTEKFSNTTAYYLGGDAHQGFVSATISDDGKTMVGATNGKEYIAYTAPGLPPVIIASTNYGNTFPTFNQGFVNIVGIAGGNVVTGTITNNYIAMMLYQIGQFNYSTDGGVSFIPKATTDYYWSQIYRKAYVYTTTTTTTTPPPVIYYYYRYDLDICCNSSNATLVWSYNIYSNGYWNIGGTVYELTAEPAATTSIQITSATAASCTANTSADWTLVFGMYNCYGTCNKYYVETDLNPCSPTYLDYRQGGVAEYNSTFCGGCCGQSTTQVWTDTGNTRCNSCVNEKEQQQTNSCASGYLTTRWVAGGSACNYDANYSSAIGTLYVCNVVGGGVNSYTVYQNTNACFNGYQFYANGNSYENDPSNSYPDTTQNWQPNGATYCSGFDLYEPQIQINPCAVNYNGVRDELIEANSPTCCEAYALYLCDGTGTSYTIIYPIGTFVYGQRVLVTYSGVYAWIAGIVNPIYAGATTVIAVGGSACPATYTQFQDCNGAYYYLSGNNPYNGYSFDLPDQCLFNIGTTDSPSGIEIYSFVAGDCICP